MTVREPFGSNPMILVSLAVHSGGICLFGTRRAFVTADGQIFPCEHVPSKPPYFQIGTVEKGIDRKKVQQLLNDFTNPTEEECKHCWALRMCNVGCLREMVDGGVPHPSKKQEECDRVRRQRHQELVGMCELFEKNPAALDHYNDIALS